MSGEWEFPNGVAVKPAQKEPKIIARCSFYSPAGELFRIETNANEIFNVIHIYKMIAKYRPEYSLTITLEVIEK